MNGMGLDMSLFGLLFFLVWVCFIVLVLGALVLAVRWLWRADQRDRPGPPPGWGSPGGSASPPAAAPTRPDDPLEILRQRYARGEIDDEEYERRRRTLTGG